MMPIERRRRAIGGVVGREFERNETKRGEKGQKEGSTGEVKWRMSCLKSHAPMGPRTFPHLLT
jgi:hypothetical protein